MESVSSSSSEYDVNSLHSDESKLRLKEAIKHLEQLLLTNDLVASESSETISHEAKEVGKTLYQSTIDMLSNKFFIDTEELIMQDSDDEKDQFIEIDTNENSKTTTPKDKSKSMEYIPLEYKIKVVNIATEHPKWNLKSLQRNGCKRLKSMTHLYRWREDIKRGGTVADKYAVIDSWTFDRFVEAKYNFQQVTTRNLQQWALSAASQFTDFSFKASNTWVGDFKRKHRIKQRKIIRYVSAKEATTVDEMLAAADVFRTQTMALIPNYNKDFIINTDQTGCQYQSTYGRILATQGTKIVSKQQKSINKITHAYTAQYAITMSGKLLPYVFICLQETTNVFGLEIQKTVDELVKIHTNVIVTCSKSGKLTNNLYTQFLKEALLPYVRQEKFLLLIDSCSGQTNPALYDEIFLDNNNVATCTIKVIPPKCTPLCQPCDVYFYRQVKNFIKRLQNCSVLVEEKREIASREDCIKIHSILHHQLSAPIFENMLRYAWFASKLTNEREVFINVNEVCFPVDILKRPCNCKKAAFIRCSRCRANYCFVCFYDKYHPTTCTLPSTST